MEKSIRCNDRFMYQMKVVPQHVIERASWTHFYVVENRKNIIGCGAIGPYWGKEDGISL